MGLDSFLLYAFLGQRYLLGLAGFHPLIREQLFCGQFSSPCKSFHLNGERRYLQLLPYCCISSSLFSHGSIRKSIEREETPNGRKRILSPEEEIGLLETVRLTRKSQHLGPIIITALNTLMRKGEILNLKWSKVDFKTGKITVEDTKNVESRIVPINQRLTETLQGAKELPKGEYVFSENGKAYRDVKTGWWTALKKAKIEGFRFHDLRHTFGTRLGMKGYDLKTIMEIMGIKDPKVAMIYLNPTPEHKRNAVESLDGVKCLTTIFTTEANSDKNMKVVSIR